MISCYLLLEGPKYRAYPSIHSVPQLQASDSSNQDITIFSFGIGDFVSRNVKEGKAEGTIEEHVNAAVHLTGDK